MDCFHKIIGICTGNLPSGNLNLSSSTLSCYYFNQLLFTVKNQVQGRFSSIFFILKTIKVYSLENVISFLAFSFVLFLFSVFVYLLLLTATKRRIEGFDLISPSSRGKKGEIKSRSCSSPFSFFYLLAPCPPELPGISFPHGTVPSSAFPKASISNF